MFYNKLIYFLSVIFFLSIINFSCRSRHKVKAKEIVSKPAKMDATVNENIKDILQFALDNNGKINDSLKISLLPVVNSFYRSNEYNNVWSKDEKWTAVADSLYNFIQYAELYGLYPNDYHFKYLQILKDNLTHDSLSKMDAILWTKADILFTDGFMQIQKHLRKGRMLPDSLSLATDSALTDVFFIKNLNIVLQNNQLTLLLNSIEPRYKGYVDLKSSLPKFLDSMNRTNYIYIVYPNKDSSVLVKTLQKRLYQSGYIASDNKIPDSVELSAAIKKAQKIVGLKTDGKISASFINKLNLNDVEKFKRIAITLDRYKQLPDSLPEKYVWVNLPGYYMKVWDHDTVAISSKVIVGKPDTRTPTLNAKISDMVTYPLWTIPTSIIKKDILPALKKNPGYLAHKGFSLEDNKGQVIDPYTINWAKYTKGIPYNIRQGSGDDNALGVLKFNFNNPYSVYLHDTNQRYLFKNSARALSHGCVRVQEWEKLAFYIARNDSMNVKPPDTLRYNTDSIKVWLANKERKRIMIKNKIPLFISYFTCEAKDGKIIFFDDIYGEDKLLREKYFANK